ncbi:MAG: alpha,alpha-trehalase [Lentisphaeria bacterium]|nr:alpha,alpha-trehalase [Lentisphaeria bacterium]
MDKISQYISDHWDDTVRYNPDDNGTLLGLPEKYIVPSVKNAFQELYYWDTYFACRGLALQGRKELVRSNAENFFYEVKKFGFIPNGSRTFYLNRSQPPFLGVLTGLILELYPDDRCLREQAREALQLEISFWDTHRRDPETGLYHYGSDPSEKDISDFFQVAVARRGADPQENDPQIRREIALATLAEAESGWDFTPRFEGDCHECAAIDLNCLLFFSFKMLAKLSAPYGGQENFWQSRADELNRNIHKYCRRQDGVFFDYNLREHRLCSVFSAASMYPLWSGIVNAADADAARKECLEKLEYPFGISAACREHAAGNWQWDYPNGWPCLQLICFEALAKYGYQDDAARIARKYINTVRENFEKNNSLWEKYNVTDGSTRVTAEYEMPEMMGWTAGVYLTAKDFLENHQQKKEELS